MTLFLSEAYEGSLSATRESKVIPSALEILYRSLNLGTLCFLKLLMKDSGFNPAMDATSLRDKCSISRCLSILLRIVSASSFGKSVSIPRNYFAHF